MKVSLAPPTFFLFLNFFLVQVLSSDKSPNHEQDANSKTKVEGKRQMPGTDAQSTSNDQNTSNKDNHAFGKGYVESPSASVIKLKELQKRIAQQAGSSSSSKKRAKEINKNIKDRTMRNGQSRN